MSEVYHARESDDNPECLFYSVQRTAVKLGIAVSTVWDWHHDGILTIKKFGERKNVILKSEVDALITDPKFDAPRGKRKRTLGIRKSAEAAAPNAA